MCIKIALPAGKRGRFYNACSLNTLFLFAFCTFISTLLLNIEKVQGQVLKQSRIKDRFNLEGVSSEVLDSFYLGLQPISTSPYRYHFRFSRNGQRLDLWSEDSVHFEGLLTNYTIQYREPKKVRKENRGSEKYQYFYTQTPLDTALAAAAFKRVWESGQVLFPTDSLVMGWQHYLDCAGFLFYFKEAEHIKLQSYYCPWGQAGTISIKKTILENEAYLRSHFQLDTSDRKFFNALLPDFSYSNNGFEFMWKPSAASAKVLKSWLAGVPRRSYLKKVKPDIDTYLNTYVKTHLPAMPVLDCNPRFWIYFDALGKFQKVMVQDYDEPKWEDRFSTNDFWADKRQLRRCKAQIEKLFRKADLSFMKLQWGFWRTISFNFTGFELEDNNAYP